MNAFIGTARGKRILFTIVLVVGTAINLIATLLESDPHVAPGTVRALLFLGSGLFFVALLLMFVNRKAN